MTHPLIQLGSFLNHRSFISFSIKFTDCLSAPLSLEQWYATFTIYTTNQYHLFMISPSAQTTESTPQRVF